MSSLPKLALKAIATMVFASWTAVLSAQLNISGYVLDENNAPIANANVFIKEQQTGTSTDAEGRYFISLYPGAYTFVFSSMGYETQNIGIILRDKDLVKNVWLTPSTEQLGEIVVKAKRRDPAYDIIQKAIDHKGKYLFQVNSLRNKVYLKASEVSETTLRPKEKEDWINSIHLYENDPLALEMPEDTSKEQLSLIEMELLLNFKAPNRYKEERIAYNEYGYTVGLFVPRFDESDFNFYNNLVTVTDVTEMPIISPLATTSILTYKFKLENSYKEGKRIVYKIKITPRKTGNSSCSGYIYINDSLWNINKIEVAFYKGSLKFYDAFSLSQTYACVQDSLWFPYTQELTYQTKDRRFTTFKGKTFIEHSEYEVDYSYPEKFFGNEIASTAADAYDKGSGYWSEIRPAPLSKAEQKMVRETDSLKAVSQTQEYKDSIDQLFNTVTPLELLYYGVAFRKAEKRYMSFAGLYDVINFRTAGGWRLGPHFFYNKNYESGKSLGIENYVNYGLKNGDVLGFAGFMLDYQPLKFGRLWGYFGKDFASINYNDAYLNQLSFSNYILVNYGELGHSIELANGLVLDTKAELIARQSLAEFDGQTFIDELIGERSPLDFEDYEAFITDLRLSYTPRQRYMMEPNKKINLGSSYPTFTLRYKKGWNRVLGSDVSFDYASIGLHQKVPLGVLGALHYEAVTGNFLNTKGLRFIDYKRFRESDPVYYSNPLNSFQLLDTSLAISSLFLEVHCIHHFNGAIVNNIPLLKKTRIMAVVGSGALWVQEAQYRYAEVFAGLERNFKMGARRRFRIGAYAVVAKSNQIPTRPGFKISLDIIDTWKRNWEF